MGVAIGILVLAGAFGVAAGFLLCEKGSWLIAGFNTASAAEKAKYDVKKLCRATGTLLMLISLLLCGMAYASYQAEHGRITEKQLLPFILVFVGVLLAASGVAIWYMNTRCKK